MPNAAERDSELLNYLAENRLLPGQRLPPIRKLSSHMGISVGKLREQLEVARQLGLVEVRPKTGIRFLGYRFLPGLWAGLRFALAIDASCFEQFEALRNHVEAAFFHEAARLLQPEDVQHLRRLIDRAWTLLRGDPIQIPHAEHREFHLTIFTRLENPFVRGLLEAYWEAYEAVGLNVYADYRFLHEVWTYHEMMVEAIQRGDFDAAHAQFVEHTALVHKRPKLARTRAAPPKAEPVMAGGAARGETR